MIINVFVTFSICFLAMSHQLKTTVLVLLQIIHTVQIIQSKQKYP